MGLAEFLTARLDEDKAGAEDIHSRDCDTMTPPGFPCDCGYPARVLREVDAKRKILALHEPNDVTGPGRACRWCGHLWPCDEVRILVAVWSDHPDYDPAWKD